MISSRSRAETEADRAVRFFSRLTHTGDYAGRPFRLRPWQEEPIRRLFGERRPDGTRKYRKSFWALPRKQGKTEVVAAGGLYCLTGEGRGKKQQRVYTAAGDTAQAALIFDAACQMIEADPVLSDRLVIYRGYKKIEYPAASSFLKVLSSTPKSKHGLGPSHVLIDEFHVVDPELVRVLRTGFGARKEPLTWMITTAGHDRHHICWDEWQYAVKVRDEVIDDPEYLPVIYAADPSDDWTDEATWRKAMPALGDFCELDFVRSEFRSARERPAEENTFKNLYLNLWTEAASRWIGSEAWAACGSEPIDTEGLAGLPCYAGLDLGVTGDMSALAAITSRDAGGWEVRMKYWAPADGRWRSEERSRDLYPRWHNAGLLEFTDGETQDHQAIEDAVVELDRETPITLLCADRAYAKQTLSRLFNRHDIAVREISQGPVSLNEAMTRLEQDVLSGSLRHGGHPILAWNVANACVKRNATGLMYLDKSSATERIDGLSALIDAYAAMICGEPDPTEDESHGAFFLE